MLSCTNSSKKLSVGRFPIYVHVPTGHACHECKGEIVTVANCLAKLRLSRSNLLQKLSKTVPGVRQPSLQASSSPAPTVQHHSSCITRESQSEGWPTVMPPGLPMKRPLQLSPYTSTGVSPTQKKNHNLPVKVLIWQAYKLEGKPQPFLEHPQC